MPKKKATEPKPVKAKPKATAKKAKKEVSPEELEIRKQKRRDQLAKAREIKAQKKLALTNPPMPAVVEKEITELTEKPVVNRRRKPPTQFLPN